MNKFGKSLLLFFSITALSSLALGIRCSDFTDSNGNSRSLVVYSGRSEELLGPLIKLFEDSTGIRVQEKYGGTAELAATILEEGANTPADVFFAQDPGGLAALEPRLSSLPQNLLAAVPSNFRSPLGKWLGLSGRARVVVFNSDTLTDDQLPDDIFDFIDARWESRIGWAPTNGSFQAMVTAMRAIWGDERTTVWLEGITANGPALYVNNTSIVAAVGAGEVDVGFVNHYYLHRFLYESGGSFSARNYHPRAGGPGALMLVAGAGILESSENHANAERFLEFMLSPVSQQYFAGQTFEYPVVEGVATNRLLTPIEDINAPDIDMATLGDLQGTLALLREVGVIP
jgi:iron(III) transport system substrate-binding protein